MESLLPILLTGELAKPGDTVLGGHTIAVAPGHITSPHCRYTDHLQRLEHFDPAQIYLSPAIEYVSFASAASNSHSVLSHTFLIAPPIVGTPRTKTTTRSGSIGKTHQAVKITKCKSFCAFVCGQDKTMAARAAASVAAASGRRHADWRALTV